MFLLRVFIVTFFISSVLSIKWLALRNLSPVWSDPKECPTNKTDRKLYGLVSHHTKICRRLPKLMPIIVNAAEQTMNICQKVFRDDRWNCSTIVFAPELKSDLSKGTKEQAFVHALSAAAVTHQTAKACASGSLPYCPCGQSETTAAPDALLSPDAYKWKGCSDNVAYGKRVSREWADALWKKTAQFFSRTLRSVLEFDEEHLNEDSISHPKIGPKARMNQHNNDIGRMVTQQSQYRKCKCHGVSSGCDIQTCWNALPSLEVIAEQLKERYQFANQIGQLVDATGSKGDSRSARMPEIGPSLIYLRTSPNYCELNMELGSLGTRGRECNQTTTGSSNCEHLCCGRGFNTKSVTVTEQCHCKYVHCCYIKCKTCTSVTDKHYCK